MKFKFKLGKVTVIVNPLVMGLTLFTMYSMYKAGHKDGYEEGLKAMDDDWRGFLSNCDITNSDCEMVDISHRRYWNI